MYDIERVFEENKGKLFAYLLRMTGSSDTAHDILQESITRCMEHYRDREVTAALMFTVARNAAIDHARRAGRYTDLEDCHADNRSDQEHEAIMRESFSHVLRGMQTLCEEERDILSMVAGSDLSYQEISLIMGTSVANIKVKVHRARLKLRQYMEGEYHE